MYLLHDQIMLWTKCGDGCNPSVSWVIAIEMRAPGQVQPKLLTLQLCATANTGSQKDEAIIHAVVDRRSCLVLTESSPNNKVTLLALAGD